MVYILKRMTVRGFLGFRDIDVEFHSNVNFLIGRNGSGKTTFVKLLHACLSLDEAELTRHRFSEIVVTYFDEQRRLSPQLKVERQDAARRTLRYHFRDHGGQKYKTYSDSRYFDQLRLQILPSEHKSQISEAKSSSLSELRSKFTKNVRFSWLPLQRNWNISTTIFSEDDQEYIEKEAIDAKILDLSNSMARYFAGLDSRAAQETRKFQEDYFLSLISFKVPDVGEILSQSKTTDIDIQKNSILEIFRTMGFSGTKITNEVESFYENAKRAVNDLTAPGAGLTLNTIFTVADSLRLTEIVKKFQEYEIKKKHIQKPKLEFATLLSEMFLYKNVIISDKNEAVIKNDITDEEIELDNLSSGEKQLFVIFAETLLQDKRRYIFLADEPELSLHIEWQEQLVKNIVKLNENCQLICATHSPDLVGVFQDNVVDFEKL